MFDYKHIKWRTVEFNFEDWFFVQENLLLEITKRRQRWNPERLGYARLVKGFEWNVFSEIANLIPTEAVDRYVREAVLLLVFFAPF